MYLYNETNTYHIMETKKLFRSKKNRKLAGVCGGLAAYTNTDATVVRIVYLLLFLFGGVGLLAYLLMWLLMPEEN